MNVHHLELFYYVAKFGGISEACRRIPYGVQQPAVSTQLSRLEDDLGVRLFERRPFRLTEPGRIVRDYISPFFGGLPDMEDLVRGQISGMLRIVGLGEVVRGFLPDAIRELGEADAGLKVAIQELDQAGCEQAVLAGHADLAFSVLSESMDREIRKMPFLTVPTGLLVRREMMPVRANQLLKRLASGDERLVSLPGHEVLTRGFLGGARRLGYRLTVSLEVTSHEMVVIYAKAGLGLGVVAWSPTFAADPALAFVPLTGFPRVEFGGFWKGDLKPSASRLLNILLDRARGIAAPGKHEPKNRHREV